MINLLLKNYTLSIQILFKKSNRFCVCFAWLSVMDVFNNVSFDIECIINWVLTSSIHLRHSLVTQWRSAVRNVASQVLQLVWIVIHCSVCVIKHHWSNTYEPSLSLDSSGHEDCNDLIVFAMCDDYQVFKSLPRKVTYLLCIEMHSCYYVEFFLRQLSQEIS